jgi:hypothetical protein
MLNGWQTIWYFLWRGVGYGTAIGAIAGTFIYPIVATVFGLFYGGSVGLVMGILLGLGVHFYNRRAYSQQLDFEEYQANLVTGAGLATAIVTAIPLLVLLAPVAGLAAAYVTHRYADDHAHHIIKRKNEALLSNTAQHMERQGVISKFADIFSAKSKWLVGVGWLLSFFAALVITEFNIFAAATLSVIAGFLLFHLMILVGLTNGMYIQMLNRVAFSPEWTQEQYKRRVMVTAGLFTLVITPIVGLLVGAPILALIASVAARDYADWYYEGHIEKAKHDAARLADDYEVDHAADADVEAEDEKAYQDFN